MSRFGRRLETSLEDPELRADYFAADAEGKLTQAINAARKALDISQRELGERLGKSQAAVSQFFSSDDGITVSRLVEYLVGLHLAAEIVITRTASEGPPVQVRVDLEPTRGAALAVDRSRILETVKKWPPTRANFGRPASSSSAGDITAPAHAA